MKKIKRQIIIKGGAIMTVPISARIDIKLKSKIEKIASKNGESISLIIVRALEQYIKQN